MIKKIKNIFLLPFVILTISIISCFGQQLKTDKFYWKNYRGVNAGTNLKEEDISDLNGWNVNLLRISMATLPILEMEEPFSLNEEAFEYLDNVLNWCEKYNISVVIDPHRYPGMTHQWTMLGNDSIWLDFKFHSLIEKAWHAISYRYKNRGNVIAGYDILNEPEISPGYNEGTPADINLLYKNIVATIRRNDSLHSIILALPRFYLDGAMRDYHEGIKFIKLPADDNLVLESHSYMPLAFSHQNVWDEGEIVHYPGEINEEYWNFKHLKDVQSELFDFSIKNTNVPIFIGEFSCPVWTGKDGVRYLKDIILLAEKNNWSWAYHSFRESPVWDAEKSGTSKNDLTDNENNARLKLLRKYFKKNK